MLTALLWDASTSKHRSNTRAVWCQKHTATPPTQTHAACFSAIPRPKVTAVCPQLLTLTTSGRGVRGPLRPVGSHSFMIFTCNTQGKQQCRGGQHMHSVSARGVDTTLPAIHDIAGWQIACFKTPAEDTCHASMTGNTHTMNPCCPTSPPCATWLHVTRAC